MTDAPGTELKIRRKRAGEGRVTRATSRPTSTFRPTKRSVLVIRDSFFNEYRGEPAAQLGGGQNQLASFFESTTFVHWKWFGRDVPQLDKHLRSADVVVVQLVQGNVGNLVRHVARLEALAGRMK